MFDLKLIRENPEHFDSGWKRRGLAPQTPTIVAMDEKKRALMKESQELQAKRNDVSHKIGVIKGQKKKDKSGEVGFYRGGAFSGDDEEQEETKLMQQVADYKSRIASLEEAQKSCTEVLNAFLSTLPNIPDKSVPDGTSDKDNKEVRRVGEPRRLNSAKDHVDIGAILGGMDFTTAAKMSGSRFVLLKHGVARLERALAQFMLDLHTGEDHGYTEMSPPLLVNYEAMYGTGQLPKFEEDLFEAYGEYRKLQMDYLVKEAVCRERNATYLLLEKYRGRLTSSMTESKDPTLYAPILKEMSEDFSNMSLDFSTQSQEFVAISAKFLEMDKNKVGKRYLVPTSEVSLTNTVLDTILDAGDLPLRMTALTPCFRSEAGAAGKDTRGMIRQHQFYKVELVSVTAEDKSMEELDRMVNCAETVLKKLDLAFRTMTLCAGDMGFSARKTYDIEVFLPGQNAFREISSCSNCGDFQARRMKARYKKEGDKNTTHVHTLNGSGVAVGRCLIAVLENYQQPDGSVVVPDALKPYMGGITKLEPVARAKAGKVANA